MNSPAASATAADPAAIFACAHSLWEACQKESDHGRRVNLSDAYSGWDQLMREVMRIGELFEDWACEHIAFDECDEVWPYFLGDRFGEAVAGYIGVQSLHTFDESDCLRVALLLNLPVFGDDHGEVPIDVTAPNTVSHSAFRQYRIQTVRQHLADGFIEAYRTDSDVDEEFSKPFIALYGVDAEGLVEHVRDFDSYRAATSFAQKLAPGIFFPDKPVSGRR